MSNLYIASPKEIREIQWLQLKKQVLYLQQNSSFYKNVFKVHEIDTAKINSYEDFQNIPLTRVEDLQANNEDFLCVDREEILDYSLGSKGSGKAAYIPYNQTDLKRIAHSQMEAFKFAGVQKSDVVQLALALDKRRLEGFSALSGLKKIGAAAIRTGNGSPKLQWNSVEQLKPKFIVVDPSFLLVMIDYARKKDIDFKNSSVKVAICVGEPFRDHQNKLNTLGKRISDSWDLELFSTYITPESATVSTECEIHKGHHIQPEFLFTEILDPAGNPVKPGETGELVITNLQAETMPLLRFATGELLTYDENPCACGRNTIRLLPGLLEEKPAPADSRLSSKDFIEILHGFEGVEAFIIEAKEGKTDSEIYTVKLANTTSTEDMQVLAGLIESRLRITPKIEMATVEQIKILKYPDKKKNAVLFRDYRKGEV